MTRDEFLTKIRALDGTPKVMVLKTGKRIRLRPIQPCAAGWMLVISPDSKKSLQLQYDEIEDLRPLTAAKRRRKAN